MYIMYNQVVVFTFDNKSTSAPCIWSDWIRFSWVFGLRKVEIKFSLNEARPAQVGASTAA